MAFAPPGPGCRESVCRWETFPRSSRDGRDAARQSYCSIPEIAAIIGGADSLLRTSLDWRLPAIEIEKVVQSQLIQLLTSNTQLLDTIPQSSSGAADIARLLSEANATANTLHNSSFDQRKRIISALVQRVVVNPHNITIGLNIAGLQETLDQKSIANSTDDDTASPTVQAITVPIALRRRGVEMKLVLNNNKPAEPATPEPGLLAMLKQAHKFLKALTDGTGLTIAELAMRERMDVSDLSRVIRFAFLAPDLAEAIVEGRQPVELTRHQLSRLPELPHLWNGQRALLSF